MEEHKEHHGEHHHKPHKKEETMTIGKVTIWKWISAILAVLLVVSIYTGGFGRTATDTVPSNGAAAQPAQPRAAPSEPSAPAQAAATINAQDLTDDDTVKGDPDAPITIAEWSDFECPFCARFYSQTFGQIDTAYIKTGKVKIAFRDFPLGFHANAKKAAETAECAGEQGKFWEMHDSLFENGVSGGVGSFKQFAVKLGLDADEFNTCLDSGAMASEVNKDMSEGQTVGISGTPGFIMYTSNDVSIEDIQSVIPAQLSRNIQAVNLQGSVGVRISGALPFEAFKVLVEVMLAK